MKKFLIILVFYLSLPAWLKGQTIPYQAGEKTTYTIRYGFVNGGIVNFELKRDTFKGKDVFHSYFDAQTVGIADAFFKIKDIYESYIEPETELPFYSIRNVHEGRYKRYNTVLFDRTLRDDSATLISNLTGKHITRKDIHDVLSFYYFFRRNWLANDYQFMKGEVVTVMTWFTDELFPVRLVYVGMEDIKTRFGRIRCYKFNPVTEVGRLFKTNNDVSIWFSADKNYIPVKVRFDIFVGAFTAELVAYEGLVGPLEIVNK